MRANRRAWSTSAASATPEPLRIGIPERHDRLAAALDEERRLARRGGRRGRRRRAPRARPARFGHGQHRAVRLRRVGGGQDERLLLLVLARPELAQPLDRAAERELRAAEPLDEVAAAAEPERLERLQLAVDGAVAAGDSLAADAVAGDDPLPLEQELGEGAAVGRRR